MGVTYRFVATVDEAKVVTEWFRALTPPPRECKADRGVLFYFSDFGLLEVDAKKSPLVTLLLPTRKRRILTTVGEVHFLSTPMSKFPRLNAISRQFRRWLEQFPCVFSRRHGFVGEWDYYLEGSIRNYDTDICALPNAMAELRAGAYFVAEEDNDLRLEKICRMLDLRGVGGIE